jgi:hypothetical protein
VVGFEAISKPGRVVWYENPPDPRGLGVEHEVAKVVGPMSLAVVDVDGDGVLDIIVGEHNLVAPHSATLWYLENRPAQPWRKHRIWTGDEHHDGLVAFDLDGDGDVDFASVGWGHGRVHVYESLASPCRSSRRSSSTSNETVWTSYRQRLMGPDASETDLTHYHGPFSKSLSSSSDFPRLSAPHLSTPHPRDRALPRL